MSSNAAAVSDPPMAVAIPPAGAWRLGRVLACVAAIAAGAGLAWQGQGVALAGLALVALAVAGWPRRALQAATSPVPEAAGRDAPAVGSRQGAALMVEQVVPVWSRQMEVTREAASDGLAQILNAFSEMSGALQSLTDKLASQSFTVEPGAVDEAVRQDNPALKALVAASERAFAERDAAVQRLSECARQLNELDDLAKRARELSRHTRLVAFNASIEANRGRTADDGGAQAVATEVRTLAARMAETGEGVHRIVSLLRQQVQAQRLQGEVQDTSAEELKLEIDLQARRALTAMVAGLGSALQGGGEVQEASRTLRDQLDATFIHFQFGDRVSQMLAIVGNDMRNFAQWVATHPHATQGDAAEWLAALEASYTMDEQRSTHHGGVHVDKGSGVDFF